jgi:hypothetical protein
MRTRAALLVLATLALGSVGCIRKMVVDGQIQAFRQASSSFETSGDYEYARSAMPAAILQFEGMHALSPDNADALFMLAKTYTGYGNLVVQDDLEAAEVAGNDALVEYHRKRARAAYDRGVFYGQRLMNQTAPGFVDAKRDEATLKKWLADHFVRREDAGALFWTGFAWLVRVDVMKGDDTEGPQFIAELFVGEDLLERAMQLDPSVEHFNALTALGAYHSRNAMAELDQGRTLFDMAMQRTRGRDLQVPYNYARFYACAKGDAALYRRLLESVLDAGDTDPEQRFPNVAAKHFAARWLDRKWAKDQCGIDLGKAR